MRINERNRLTCKVSRALTIFFVLAAALGWASSMAWAGHAPTPGGPPPAPNNPPPQPPCNPNGGTCCKTGSGGQHVDFWNGREFLKHTDLALSGLMPIVVQRSYDSQAQYDSALGYGWAINYFMRLYEYADGSVTLRRDCGVRRGFLLTGGAYQTPVGETGVLVRNADAGWTYTDKSGERSVFDSQGRLVAIVSVPGPYLALQYDTRGKLPLIGLSPYAIDSNPKEITREHRLLRIEERLGSGAPTGRFVTFSYDDATGRLVALADSAGRTVSYQHDGAGNLTQVELPEGAALSYAYEDPRDPHNATALTDSGCSACGGFSYQLTYDAQDRVIREQVGSNVMRVTYTQTYAKTIVDEDVSDDQGTPLSTATTSYEFNGFGNPTRITDALGHQKVYVYDANMNVIREERWENTGGLTLRYVEEKTYDARGNVVRFTEAKGTAQQRVTDYTYDLDNRLLTISMPSVVDPARTKVTQLSYTPTTETVTESGLLGDGSPYSYTTVRTFDASGRPLAVDGPRTDVADVTTFAYDASGNLVSVLQPAGLTTAFADYTASGQPGRVTDPNGVTTAYAYDALGRVRSVEVAGRTTSYAYTPSGKLLRITLPRGNALAYAYDPIDRLVSIQDGLGNKIVYAYDSAGRRLREEIKDAGGVLQKTVAFQNDLLGRLKRLTNPDGGFSEYDYDFASRQKTVKDPKGNLTSYQYDVLSRLTQVNRPGSAITAYTYNSQGRLASLTDANGNVTAYSHDDMGRVFRVVSPDEGTTTRTYDAAGNPTAKTDARGFTVAYQYDALNRILAIDFPADPDVSYTYDVCPNGKGRLCRIVDQAGSVDFAYDAHGELSQETRVVNGVSSVTGYGYDSNGNLVTLTYPGGRSVTYAHDAADRIVGVTTTPPGGGTPQTVVAGVNHKPRGGVAALVYGNGRTRTLSYDLQYRITGISTTGTQDLTYVSDLSDNITSIVNGLDASKSSTFGYDSSNRLISATGFWGSLGWTYDGVGNRLSQTAPEGSSTYAYQTGSNRLGSVTGPTALVLGYDAAGNTTLRNGTTFTYSQDNRLTTAAQSGILGEYGYDSERRRVTKTVSGQTTVFHYDRNGRLLTETSGASSVDYIYLDEEPVARAEGANLAFIHGDHLGTPQAMTDSAGTKIWEIAARPFGDGAAVTGTAGLELRFPGQYHDPETGLHQNWFRTYDAAVGRYLSPDPLGVTTVSNVYRYADASPVNFIDPTGLASIPPVNPKCSGKSSSAVYVICCDAGGGIGICKGPEPTPSSSHVNDCMLAHENKHIIDLTIYSDIFPCDKAKCTYKVQLYCAIEPGNKNQGECSGYCAELACLERKPQFPEVRTRITAVKSQMRKYCPGRGELGCVGP